MTTPPPRALRPDEFDAFMRDMLGPNAVLLVRSHDARRAEKIAQDEARAARIARLAARAEAKPAAAVRRAAVALAKAADACEQAVLAARSATARVEQCEAVYREAWARHEAAQRAVVQQVAEHAAKIAARAATSRNRSEHVEAVRAASERQREAAKVEADRLDAARVEEARVAVAQQAAALAAHQAERRATRLVTGLATGIQYRFEALSDGDPLVWGLLAADRAVDVDPRHVFPAWGAGWPARAIPGQDAPARARRQYSAWHRPRDEHGRIVWAEAEEVEVLDPTERRRGGGGGDRTSLACGGFPWPAETHAVSIGNAPGRRHRRALDSLEREKSWWGE